MVSPEHIDEKKHDDKQVSDPTEEKQALLVGEKKRPWLEPLLRVTGIVLSLGGSFAIAWAIFNDPSITVDPGLALLGGLLIGAVSAGLFWSWWAILEIPIAFVAGEFLAFYLIPQVISPNPFEIGDASFGQALWAVAGPITATFGAIIGAFIGMSWKKRQQL